MSEPNKLSESQEQNAKEEIEKIIISFNEELNEQPIAEKKKSEDIDEEEEPTVNYCQWLKRGKSLFFPADDAKTIKEIDPGFYTIKYSEKQGYYLFKKELKLDDLIELPSKGSEEVMESIQTFWDRKDKFKEYGFAYKRGILLYGPAGTGKSSIINLLAFNLIEKKNGVIFTIKDADDLSYYLTFIPEIFRVIEKDRPIITIIEDIDGLCESSRVETTLINMLDGIEQMDNVVYIATTNFMEKLTDRIANRPNRFDRRIFVGYPVAKVRKKYIQFKLKPDDLKRLGNTEIDRWVKDTKGLTISHIGEMIKSIVIMGNTYEDTMKTLKKFKDIPSSSQYNKTDFDDDEDETLDVDVRKIGFGN